MKVVELPIHNLNDIPLMARCFAENVEAGEMGDVVSVIAIVESENGIHIRLWGKCGDQIHDVGLLEVAKYELLVGAGE